MSKRRRLAQALTRMISGNDAVVLDRQEISSVLEAPVGGLTAGSGNGIVVQSADQLIEILKRSTEGEAGLHLGISEQEALRNFTRWQFAVASVIAESIMMVPWSIQERQSDGKWKDVPGHSLEKTLRYVNPYMTWEDLIYGAVVELVMVGKSFCNVVLNGLNEPAEYWPVVGNMKPKLGSDGMLEGWTEKLTVKGEHITQEYAPEEVVFLRFPKPKDPWGGFGPGMAAGSAIKLDQKVVEAQWAAMKQGIYPFAILLMAERNPARRQEMVDEFNELYAGADKRGKALGLNKGKVEILFPTTKPSEMGFEQSEHSVRDQILATARVPKSILGLTERVPLATARAMEYVFAKFNIAPKLQMIESRWNQDAVEPFYGTDTRLHFESPVPLDREQARKERATNMENGVLSIDEARREYGLEPYEQEWSEVPLLPAGRVPASSYGEAAQQQGGAEQQVARLTAVIEAALDGRPDEARRLLARVEPPKAIKVLTEGGFSKRVREEIADRGERHRQKLEATVRKKVATYFEDLGKRVLHEWDESEPRQGQQEAEPLGRRYRVQVPGSNVGDPYRTVRLQLPPPVDRVLDPQTIADEMAAWMRDTNTGGIVIGGAFQKDLAPGEIWEWDETLPEVKRYAAEFGKTHYMEVAEVTRQRYVEVVAEGLAENESWAQLRARIVQEMGRMTESRAANIATTETTKLYGSGMQAFREVNQIEKKQWVATYVNTRDTHAEADGQVRRNEELFDVGRDRMKFPGDGTLAEENCNCNCLAVAFFEPGPITPGRGEGAGDEG